MKPYFSITHASDINWSMPQAHFHDNFEILLSMSDDCGVFIHKASFPLKRGSLAFIAGGTLHRNFSAEGSLFDRYSIHFSHDTLRYYSSKQTDILGIFSQLNTCYDLDAERTDALLWLIENCLRQSGQEFGDDVRRNIFFGELLLELCKIVRSGKFPAQQPQEESSKANAIIAHINQNLIAPISLDELASTFEVNKFYLCHLFKNATGFTVVEYVNSRRILLASKLLKDGIAVQQAGQQAGFANAAHFIRSFRKFTGQTPGQYARANKSNIV